MIFRLDICMRAGENTRFNNFCLARSCHALHDATTDIVTSTIVVQVDMV